MTGKNGAFNHRARGGLRSTPTTFQNITIPMPNVQVILKEKIGALGAEADIVTVKAGYARNYLVPQGKAFEATPGNLRHLNNLKSRRASRESEERAAAQTEAGKLRKQSIRLILDIGQGGKAFGAITAGDIATAIKEQTGVVVDRHAITLEKPIKATGKHEVEISLYSGVDVTVKLIVSTPAVEGEAEDAGAES